MQTLVSDRDILGRRASDVLLRGFGALGAFLGAAGLVLPLDGAFEQAAVALSLALSAALVYQCRSNAPLLVMSVFIAYANYSALAANYLAVGYEWFMFYRGTRLAATGTFTLLVFMGVLNFWFPREIAPFAGSSFFSRCPGGGYVLVPTLLAGLLWLISIFNFRGSAATGGRASSNQLYEYSYILFIIGFYLCGSLRPGKLALSAVSLVYILQSVAGGNRASVLALALLLYLLFLAPKWGSWKTAALLSAGLFVFQAVGYLRQAVFSTGLGGLSSAWRRLAGNSFVWDTAGAAFHQGMVFFRYMDMASEPEMARLRTRWLESILMGGSAVSDSQISLFVQKVFSGPSEAGLGGGFLPEYGYFYFGVMGVIVCGVVAAIAFRFVASIDEADDLRSLLGASLFCTLPRWYLYSPSPLTRGVLLMAVAGGVPCSWPSGLGPATIPVQLEQ